uniref:Neuroserpin n=2 Tax=Lygus hesperus TaxID=30085 RepID=A0A0A9YR10_LYGHE
MVRGRYVVGSTFLLGLAALVAMASSSADLDALRSGSAKFSQDLFSVLREGKENENMVASPISLQIALAMLYAGAQGNTKTQLTSVLHVDTDDLQKYLGAYKELLETIKDPVLSVASTVFVNLSLNLLDNYTTAVSTGFGANVEKVDFKQPDVAAKTINDWCDTHTNGKIKDLFSAGDLALAEAVLANAVYFKAQWKTKFNPELTKERDFKSPTGIVKVQMMNVKSNFKYAFSEKLNAQVLELPYANDKFRMLVILPSEGVALKDVESNVKTIGLDEVMKTMYSTEVDVFLPRFKIEMTHDLNAALQKLGAADLFSSQANLSGMSESPLFVSQVKQKVFIEVNEEGTEAAAVTGVVNAGRSMAPPRRKTFIVNRPFSFVLINRRTTTQLFVGHITKPKRSK